MKVLIVDDEPPARDRLHRLLEEIEDTEVVGEAGNGNDALVACAMLKPDVVLLDVRMPGLWGIEVAQHLSTLADAPAVIFTTAYGDHAIDAFDAQAIGYLLKPVRKEKLARALIHASRISVPRLMQATRTANIEQRREHVCARLGDQLRLIPIADIYYFFADQKYVTVHHKGGEDLIDEPLKELSVEFASDFVRVHRNALVAEKHIAAVERNDQGQYVVRVRDCDVALQVSRRHATELLRRVRGAE
ncbi:MAG TPA: LytTR family DNA-binding domain-containing protein [Steroidobacteraceae bacterium]|nr:LytTR family DNA-binding domain-containing protein [Steroidobacteraceae bacterium]